jgi:predicted RNA-binding Zn-ribbon protein involved in translation (DUF1610 family)
VRDNLGFLEENKMRTRRGSSFWPDGLSDMLIRFQPGDLVVPITSKEDHFLGVVKEVLPKINKVMVLWNGGSLKQHDPDEIHLENYQNPIVRSRMAKARRVRGKAAAEFSSNFQHEGVRTASLSPRNIVRWLQRNINKLTGVRPSDADEVFDRMVEDGDADDTDRDYRAIEDIMETIGDAMRDARRDFRSIVKSLDPMSLRSSDYSELRSRRAMYWGAPDRVYRLTRTEQENGNAVCPKCKKEMQKEPFTKSDKLYTCQSCGFKVPTSKTTTTRITVDVDKDGEVDVDVTTAGKEKKAAKEHELKIVSLHDGMAECSAGDWHFSHTGPITKQQIEKEFEKHLNSVGNRKAAITRRGRNSSVARELVAIEFPTQDAYDKYMKDHPDADKSNHRVVEQKKEPAKKDKSKPREVGTGKKLFEPIDVGTKWTVEAERMEDGSVQGAATNADSAKTYMMGDDDFKDSVPAHVVQVLKRAIR